MSNAEAKGYANNGQTCWLASIYQSLISVKAIRDMADEFMKINYDGKIQSINILLNTYKNVLDYYLNYRSSNGNDDFDCLLGKKTGNYNVDNKNIINEHLSRYSMITYLFSSYSDNISNKISYLYFELSFVNLYPPESDFKCIFDNSFGTSNDVNYQTFNIMIDALINEMASMPNIDVIKNINPYVIAQKVPFMYKLHNDYEHYQNKVRNDNFVIIEPNYINAQSLPLEEKMKAKIDVIMDNTINQNKDNINPLYIYYSQYFYGDIAIISISGFANKSINTCLQRKSNMPLLIPNHVNLISTDYSMNTYHLVSQIRKKPGHFITAVKRNINDNDKYYIINDDHILNLDNEYVYNDTVFLVYESEKNHISLTFNNIYEKRMFYRALWGELISSSKFLLYSDKPYKPIIINDNTPNTPNDVKISELEYICIKSFVKNFIEYIVSSIYMNGKWSSNLLYS
jgi:hypothetical protein